MLQGREVYYLKKIKEITDKGNETQEMTTAEIEKLELYVQALLIERRVQVLEEQYITGKKQVSSPFDEI